MEKLCVIKSKEEYNQQREFFSREIPIVYERENNKERAAEILDFFDGYFDEHKNNFFAILVENKRIKSIARFQFYNNLDCLFITGAQTAPEFRKQGCAYRLLENTISYVQRVNKDVPIKLWVNKTNTPAVKLYKKLGFEITSKEDKNIPLKFIEMEYEDIMTYKNISKNS